MAPKPLDTGALWCYTIRNGVLTIGKGADPGSTVKNGGLPW